MKRGRRRGRQGARHGRAVEHESTRGGHGHRPWAATAARPGPVSSVECDGGALLLSVGQHEGNDHQLLPFGTGGYALASALCITSTGSFPWDVWT
jgi:hypothetical protein